MRVLIADNNDDFRTVLTQLLERNGWEVWAGVDGREALYLYHKALHSEKYFDLLLLDVEMPRLNGFAVGVNVRNLEAFGDIPRAVHIYLTGHEDVVPPERLVDILFADGYVHKPIASDILLAKIDDLIRKNQERTE